MAVAAPIPSAGSAPAGSPHLCVPAPRCAAAPAALRAIRRAAARSAARAAPRAAARSALPSALVLPLLLACASPPAPDPQARREALADAGDRLWDAYARQDLEEVRRWLDDEAVLIGERRIEGSDGIVAFLRRYLEGVQVQGWAHTQRSLRLAGEVGLVSYWREETGLADEEPYRDSSWVNEVWIERDGRWRCLLIHVGANQSTPPPELQE